MNYRHAFHAGNHLDVFKHAALSLLLARLTEKAQPVAYLETHAGVGLYDLGSEPAQRTGEAQDGVARIFGRPLAAAPAYGRLLEELNPDGLRLYPGSPEIARRLTRPADRVMLCELHPEDAAELKARYRTDRRIGVHARVGYEAVRALLPPAERRGLVLIDPPFESPDEARRLANAVAQALGKWPTGVVAAWYPVKDDDIGRNLVSAARRGCFPKALQAEFLAYRADEALLRGGGLLICNAPWRLDRQLAALCAELSALLGAGHAAGRVDWLTPQ